MLIAISRKLYLTSLKNKAVPKIKCSECGPLFIVCFHLFKTTGCCQNMTNYSFAPSVGTFTALAGATNPTLTTGNANADYFNAIPIGFDFLVYGHTQYYPIGKH